MGNNASAVVQGQFYLESFRCAEHLLARASRRWVAFAGLQAKQECEAVFVREAA